MRRLLLLTLACALAPSAPAAATTLAPPGSHADTPFVAPGPGATALVTWRAGQSVQTAELGPSGFGAPRTVLQAPAVGPSPVGLLDPGDRTTVVAARGTRPNVPTEAVALLGDATERLTTGSFVEVLAAAGNERGDAAVVVATRPRHAELLTRSAGGAFLPPLDLGPGFVEQPTVAVGPTSRVVVAYYDGVSRVYARSGQAGGALGPPQLLARTRNAPTIAAAVDARGGATVVFNRTLGRNAIAMAASRARPGGAPFGAPVILDRGPNAQFPQAAAAGDTTAVAWISLTRRGGVRVTQVRGAGRLGHAQAPATPTIQPRGEAGRFPSEAGVPHIAVDERGDVLLTYPYGPFFAVHAVMRRAGSGGFGAPRVLSALGEGGPAPVAALLGDRRPLVAYGDGDALRATTGRGRALALRVPGLTLSRLREREVRDDGRATVTVRCPRRCVVRAIARLTTGRGRVGAGQVISRQGRAPQVLAANTPLRMSFALTPAGRAAFAQTGRAQVRVTVTAGNATGVARTARATLDIGR